MSQEGGGDWFGMRPLQQFLHTVAQMFVFTSKTFSGFQQAQKVIHMKNVALWGCSQNMKEQG